MVKKIILILTLSVLFSSGHIENPDTSLRMAQARFLIKNGSFEIEKGTGELSHGNIARNAKGARFSVYNPGQILLFVPVYLFADLVTENTSGSYYTAAFLSSFLGYIIYGTIILIFWEFGKQLAISFRKRLYITLLFAFTSYCFAHAQDGYEQLYESMFIFLTILIIFKKNNSANNILLASLSLGFALLFRSSSILALPAILWLIANWRHRFYFLSGIFPFILIILYYNYIRFGNPFESGYAIAWSDAFGKSVSNSFNVMDIPRNISGLLFSFGKGLLIFSPSIILVIFSYRKFWNEHRRLCISIIILSLCYIFFYSANFAWHGSAWNWGPRYIVPIVPLIYICLFYISAKRPKFVIAIAAVSFIIQILAISTFYKRNLIKTLLTEGDIFWTTEYFFSPRFSPIKGQVISFLEVSQSMASKVNKNLYLFDGPWKNESRPATQEMMLANSIDLNVYNFWWARQLFINNNRIDQLIVLSIFFTALSIALFQLRVLWRHLR